MVSRLQPRKSVVFEPSEWHQAVGCAVQRSCANCHFLAEAASETKPSQKNSSTRRGIAKTSVHHALSRCHFGCRVSPGLALDSRLDQGGPPRLDSRMQVDLSDLPTMVLPNRLYFSPAKAVLRSVAAVQRSVRTVFHSEAILLTHCNGAINGSQKRLKPK